MAEITFNGQKSLKSIAKSWSQKFPHLWIRFYDSTGKHCPDWSVTHGSIRGKKDAEELSTNANLNVGTFEARYNNAFGAKVEIMYTKNNRSYHSLEKANAMTLSEYNAYAKTLGADEILKTHPEWF